MCLVVRHEIDLHEPFVRLEVRHPVAKPAVAGNWLVADKSQNLAPNHRATAHVGSLANHGEDFGAVDEYQECQCTGPSPGEAVVTVTAFVWLTLGCD